jgi:hypothetical protein
MEQQVPQKKVPIKIKHKIKKQKKNKWILFRVRYCLRKTKIEIIKVFLRRIKSDDKAY